MLAASKKIGRLLVLLLTTYPLLAEAGGRRAGSGRRCLSALVEPPTIGQCTNLFIKAVEYRACVSNESEVQAKATAARTKLSVSDLSVYVNLAQSFLNQQCRLIWQNWVTPPYFVYTCYGGTKNLQPCNGPEDHFTCTLGTCIQLQQNPNWPVNWWNMIQTSQFGGIPTTLYNTRQWYCPSQLEYELGTVSLGSVTETVYAPSSNPWILSECDLVDRFGLPLPNADAQCENVTDTNPVKDQCCGYCVLNNAHLMRMWNCTALGDLAHDPVGLNALAQYCRLGGCKETRPCLGSPVKMGDPKTLLNPLSYAVQCDQLNSGCQDQV
mmetsp:Transcript_37726/g.119175  ORF Transcript_37726/g.119175 Transcript_37726/m.119175 type:complete len:324 (+) Transcript_37726:76-1047(+)